MPLPDKNAMEMTDAEFRAAKQQMRVDGVLADDERRRAETLKRLERKYGKPGDHA